MQNLTDPNVAAKEESDTFPAMVVVTDDEPCRGKAHHEAMLQQHGHEQLVSLLTYTGWTKEVRAMLDHSNQQHRKLFQLCDVLDRLRTPLMQHSLQAVAAYHETFGMAEAHYQRRVAVFAAHHGPYTY